MNTKFRVETTAKPRKSSISPWDSDEAYECFSPLRRMKLIQQQSVQATQQVHKVEGKIPEKKLTKTVAPSPDSSIVTGFVVRKHHKTVPKCIVTVEIPVKESKEQTVVKLDQLESNKTQSPVLTTKTEATMKDFQFMNRSTPMPTLSSPQDSQYRTISVPLQSQRTTKRNTLANIRELLMDMKHQQSTRSQIDSIKNVSFLDGNPEEPSHEHSNQPKYVRRSWKSRQRTDYRIFERPQ